MNYTNTKVAAPLLPSALLTKRPAEKTSGLTTHGKARMARSKIMATAITVASCLAKSSLMECALRPTRVSANSLTGTSMQSRRSATLGAHLTLESSTLKICLASTRTSNSDILTY